jgi:hypothetical protein
MGSFTLSSAGRANSAAIWAHLGLLKQCRSITSITQWGRIAENGQVVNDWGNLCRTIESQRASAPTMPGTADRADLRNLRTHAPYNLSVTCVRTVRPSRRRSGHLDRHRHHCGDGEHHAHRDDGPDGRHRTCRCCWSWRARLRRIRSVAPCVAAC